MHRSRADTARVSANSKGEILDPSVPLLQGGHGSGNFVPAVPGVVPDDPPEEEVGVHGLVAEEKRMLPQHLVKTRKVFRGAGAQFINVRLPLGDASTSELTFLVPQHHAARDWIGDGVHKESIAASES